MPNLTDKNKLVLGPGSYQDTKQKGLRLVVSPLGKAVWQAYFHSPARKGPFKKKIGLAEAMSVKQARAEVARLKVEHAEGRAEVKRGGVPTFREMLESHGKPWLEIAFRLSFSDWLDRRMDSLTREEVERRHAQISRRGASAASKAARALRCVYNAANEHDRHAGVNMGKYMPLAKDVVRKVWLDTKDKRQRFHAVLENPGQHGLQPWCRNYFLLLYETGARKSELRCARWADVNLETSTWTVPAEYSKSGLARPVYLCDEAIVLFKLQQAIVGDSSPWCFPSPRYPDKHLADERPGWIKVRDAAGLDGTTTHDLRRTFASLYVTAGASMKTVATALGHAQESTTEEHYGHLAPSAVFDMFKLKK